MFLAYATIALFIIFGVVAIFTSMLDRRGKHDWVPTGAGGMIGEAVLVLFIVTGIWLGPRRAALVSSRALSSRGSPGPSPLGTGEGESTTPLW